VIQYISRNGKKFNSNAKFIKSLNIGDILDVRLQDGMEVLFNRNPTIREESINAHIVKVHKDPHKKTVTINPAVCTAYGADQKHQGWQQVAAYKVEIYTL
jgi:DNA-directed RNA polymerase beta' subunit